MSKTVYLKVQSVKCSIIPIEFLFLRCFVKMATTQIDKNYSPKLLLGLESLWREQTFVDTTLVFGTGCTFLVVLEFFTEIVKFGEAIIFVADTWKFLSCEGHMRSKFIEPFWLRRPNIFARCSLDHSKNPGATSESKFTKLTL